MKIIHVSHTDLDGIGAIILSKYLVAHSSVELEYYTCGYHSVEEKIASILDRMDAGEDIKLVITDISFREISGLAERIDKSYGDKVVLLDHHATSNYLNTYSWAKSKEANENGELTCGTAWYYEYLMSNADTRDYFKKNQYLATFVRLVNLWDTWRWMTDFDEPKQEASTLNMVLNIKGKEWFMKDVLEKAFNPAAEYMPFDFTESDEILIHSKKLEIERQIDSKEKELVTGRLIFSVDSDKQIQFAQKYLQDLGVEQFTKYKNILRKGFKCKFNVGVIYLTENISDVGNELARRHSELDIIIIISMPNSVSYRTVKDLSVPLGIIANWIGNGKGGGHPQSAGSVLSNRAKQHISSTILKDVYFDEESN